MSAKMKRRRRQARHKRVLMERRHRAEDRRFFEDGTFPASANIIAVCSCGARAFSRNPHDHLDEFAEAHAYCDEVGDDEYTDWSDGAEPLLAVTP